MSIRKFVMKDQEVEFKDCHEVKTFEECKQYNAKGYGVFMTFNTFVGERRLAENVTEICFWACDIDGGNKEEQLERINSLAIKPTIIIESCNGYHCYWAAKDGTVENYERIEKGIIKRLDADPKAKDPSRLLRMPGFYHLKDINKPFLVKVHSANKQSYSEDLMLYYFAEKEKQKEKIDYTVNPSEYTNPENWERIFKISQIVKGERNSYLYWVMRRLEDANCSSGDIKYCIEGMNRMLSQPLKDCEIKSLLRGRRIY